MPAGAMMNGMMMQPQQGGMGLPLTPQFNPMSIGGNQNVPSLYGGGAGFGGYNAGMVNPGNLYGGPVGSQQNPYSNYNLTAMSPNQGLGQLSSQMGYLQDTASGLGAGAAVNQTPAWQAMVNAQNYNIQQGADNLAEQFNNGGGLFSTAYGGAQGLYQEQAKLGQNAQLTSATTQAQQQALQNQLAAQQQLSSQGYGALNTLSGQNFNAALQAAQQQYGAAQQNAGYQYGAGSQLASQAAQAGMLVPGYQQSMLQTALGGAQGMGNLGLENLGMGNTLGNSQLLANQNQLTAAYQNWYNSQPQNNPLLSMMYAGATGYPQLQQSTYNPGALGSLLGGLGGLVGGIGGLGGINGLGGLISLSDRRLKENVTRIGKIKDVSIYRFNFPGQPTQTGVMAQQVARRHPEVVIRGDKNTPWLVNYTKLAQALGVR